MALIVESPVRYIEVFKRVIDAAFEKFKPEAIVSQMGRWGSTTLLIIPSCWSTMVWTAKRSH